ncbi:hypothetical protein POL68_36540 [Stigmatella sp. ncwal1]|uniref:Lipoprotein MlpA n=1 Tax=Stigmatella ashevillensis TaxID=2995309 RepID=A0ABT5DNT0_9BACT|nr:hypothetical protein [Stigmatella ashevillena]MDC0714031.1 hypothetical protein [Stigmatella ashevillena]
MIKNIVSTVTVLASASLLLAGCDQPSAGCIVQDSSSWYAKYDLKEGQTISDACRPLVPQGELVGVFKYVDPEVADSGVLTLRPAALASRSLRDPSFNNPKEGVYPQTAIADLESDPDADDFCGTSNWKPASVTATATSTVAATDISYAYNNVKVFARPDAPGTQMTGDVSYSRTENGVTCTAQMVMRAMWPAVACNPDNADSCGPSARINPAFAVVCDPVLKYCVPSKPIPSFKDE